MKFSNMIEFVAWRIASSIAGKIWSPLMSVSMRLPSVIGAPSDCARSSAKARVTPAPGGGALRRSGGSNAHEQSSNAKHETTRVLNHCIPLLSVRLASSESFDGKREIAADALAITDVEEFNRIEIIRQYAAMF